MNILKSIIVSIRNRLNKKIQRLILKKNRVSPGVYLSISSLPIKKIVIYLDCFKTCKLGDTYFFKNTINYLGSNKEIDVILVGHKNNYDLLEYISNDYENINVVKGRKIIGIDNNTIEIFMIGNSKLEPTCQNFLILDPHRFDYELKINYFILGAIRSLVEYACTTISSENGDYILLCPDLGSQKFMGTKEKSLQLYNYAKKFANLNGLEIILISSSQNSNFNKCIDPSKISYMQLVELISSKACKAIFTYDSFMMHLAHDLNKMTYVKFRGKLTKYDYKMHYEKVNNAFNDNINYI